MYPYLYFFSNVELLQLLTSRSHQEAEADLASPSETWNNAQWGDGGAGVNHAHATYVRAREPRPAAHQNSNDSLGGWEDGEFQPIEENVDGECEPRVRGYVLSASVNPSTTLRDSFVFA